MNRDEDIIKEVNEYDFEIFKKNCKELILSFKKLHYDMKVFSSNDSNFNSLGNASFKELVDATFKRYKVL